MKLIISNILTLTRLTSDKTVYIAIIKTLNFVHMLLVFLISPIFSRNKPSFCLISASNNSSFTDLTPSPSDSGVSELEAALKDRDSELAYLRQTMEHNEQVIFRVYQEKEKVWERELKRLKTVQENRLRASAQKVRNSIVILIQVK